MRHVIIYQLADHAATLAILIQAKTPVRNRFRADVLKTAENRVLFGDLECLPENLDSDQPFVRPKNLIRSIYSDSFHDLRSGRL